MQIICINNVFLNLLHKLKFLLNIFGAGKFLEAFSTLIDKKIDQVTCLYSHVFY